MIKRIVKLTFRETETENFLKIFKSKKKKIRASEGCLHLELWQDVTTPNIFFTYSFWNSEDDLNAYRHSDLFRNTWKETKKLFSDKPEAWSVEMIESTED